MDAFRVRSGEQGQARIRNVPIAVTPEGFWCCPSPVVFQKTLKTQINAHNKQRPPPPSQKNSMPKAQSHPPENNPSTVPSRPRVVFDGHGDVKTDSNSSATQPAINQRPCKPNAESIPRKVSVEFGEAGSSDLKVVLSGKQGVVVKVSVHKKVLAEQSKYFAERIPDQSSASCVEIGDCEDIEIYVETIGLMYCKDVKQRLMKQSVPRVLRILKVAELIGFATCIQSCLEYLEAAPWVGEEEEKVVSSIARLQIDNKGKGPVLKRVASEIPNPPNDTLLHILDLVLKSSDERARRDMKALVLKLLRSESSGSSNGISDSYNDNIYSSCSCCLASLLGLFKEASEPGLDENGMDKKGSIVKQIALEADNLLWLLEILISRQVADEFAVLWYQQTELAALHPKLPIVSRYLVSCITARLFVGIGRGEMLPCKETRHLLLQTWLQPLISDYSWLQHGCRSFDKKMVEEGIGRTILTLPLEDQQNILLSWMGSFLKAGDNCPNLHRAFEVWWRRTFVRPYVEQQGNLVQSTDDGTTADL